MEKCTQTCFVFLWQDKHLNMALNVECNMKYCSTVMSNTWKTSTYFTSLDTWVWLPSYLMLLLCFSGLCVSYEPWRDFFFNCGFTNSHLYWLFNCWEFVFQTNLPLKSFFFFFLNMVPITVYSFAVITRQHWKCNQNMFQLFRSNLFWSWR